MEDLFGLSDTTTVEKTSSLELSEGDKGSSPNSGGDKGPPKTSGGVKGPPIHPVSEEGLPLTVNVKGSQDPLDKEIDALRTDATTEVSEDPPPPEEDPRDIPGNHMTNNDAYYHDARTPANHNNLVPRDHRERSTSMNSRHRSRSQSQRVRRSRSRSRRSRSRSRGRSRGRSRRRSGSARRHHRRSRSRSRSHRRRSRSSSRRRRRRSRSSSIRRRQKRARTRSPPRKKSELFWIVPEEEENQYEAGRKMADHVNRASREFVAEKLLQEKIMNLHPVPTNFREPPELDAVTQGTLTALNKTYAVQKDNSLRRAQSKIRDAFGPFSRVWKKFEEFDPDASGSKSIVMNYEDTKRNETKRNGGCSKQPC